MEKNLSISLRAICLIIFLSLLDKNPWISPKTAWLGLGNLSNIEISPVKWTNNAATTGKLAESNALSRVCLLIFTLI